jgi:TonB family protein
MRRAVLFFACLGGIAALPQPGYSPARYQTGTMPALPAMVVGGGEVMLEVTVSRTGDVIAVAPLRTTPPFTDLVAAAVRGWRFTPAEQQIAHEGERPSQTTVDSKILVAAVIRPPSIHAPTFGESPKDVATASEAIAVPLVMSVPPFPPSAAWPGVVLVEVRMDDNGGVSDATVLRSAPPFDDAARAVIKTWKFRPARVREKLASTFVYVLFGFPTPVTSALEDPDNGRRKTEAEP